MPPAITVHQSPGRLVVRLPHGAGSPFPEVREAAELAGHWNERADHAVALAQAGERTQALQVFGYTLHPGEDASEAVQDYVQGARREATRLAGAARLAELAGLQGVLPPKTRVQRAGEEGVYELKGPGASLFAVVPSLQAAGLEVVVISELAVTPNPAVACTPSCRNAKGPSCECSCGGRRHGVSIPGWRVVLEVETEDGLRRELEHEGLGTAVA